MTVIRALGDKEGTQSNWRVKRNETEEKHIFSYEMNKNCTQTHTKAERDGEYRAAGECEREKDKVECDGK